MVWCFDRLSSEFDGGCWRSLRAESVSSALSNRFSVALMVAMGDQGSSCVSAFAQRDGPEARKGGRVTVEELPCMVIRSLEHERCSTTAPHWLNMHEKGGTSSDQIQHPSTVSAKDRLGCSCIENKNHLDCRTFQAAQKQRVGFGMWEVKHMAHALRHATYPTCLMRDSLFDKF